MRPQPESSWELLVVYSSPLHCVKYFWQLKTKIPQSAWSIASRAAKSSRYAVISSHSSYNLMKGAALMTAKPNDAEQMTCCPLPTQRCLIHSARRSHLLGVASTPPPWLPSRQISEEHHKRKLHVDRVPKNSVHDGGGCRYLSRG